MKKSRLRLFKSTSTMISILGIVMIASTIIIAAYMGINMLSSGITGNINSGAQYDELAAVEADFNDLETQFNSTKPTFLSKLNGSAEKEHIAAQLEIVRAKSAIDDAYSALKSKESSKEVDSRIEIAKNKVKTATESFKGLRKKYNV